MIPAFLHRAGLAKAAAAAPYAPNLVDTNGTAYLTAPAGTNSAFLTLSAWITQQSPDTGYFLSLAGGNFIAKSGVSGTQSKFDVKIEDSAGTSVYRSTSTSAVFTNGGSYHIAVIIDLSAPSAIVAVNGTDLVATGAMTDAVSLIAGTGTIDHDLGTWNLLTAGGGSNIPDVHISDLFIDTTQTHSLASLYNGGTPPDLTGVGNPYIWLGGDMTADERAGNAGQGWNDSFNLGIASVTTVSNTFTDVP